MSVCSRLFTLLCLLLLSSLVAHAQTYHTGDNSSVADCNHYCTHNEANITCLDGNAHFFERILMGHLRYYIASQVEIDLWHLNHERKERRFVNETFDYVRAGLQLQWRGEKDVVTEEMIDALASIVAQRTNEINERNRTYAPPTHCPIPCEYTHTLYQVLLGLSVALNGVLIGVLIACNIWSANLRYGTHRMLGGHAENE